MATRTSTSRHSGTTRQSSTRVSLSWYQQFSNTTPEVERVVHFPEQSVAHVTNKVSTTRYKLITFLPMELFDQFRRFANLYFLAVAVLQLIPDVSLTAGVPTILPPLGTVLGVTLIKDAYEDWRRNRGDNEINHREVQVWIDGAWAATLWKRVVVGDIVQSSDPDGGCFVETKNLDGETNLKPRTTIKNTCEATIARGCVECEAPNKNITTFTGTLKLEEDEQSLPIGPQNVLLRGTKLENTEWVRGVVVYTGRETKVMMNATETPIKKSDLDFRTNPMIAFTFGLQVGLALLLAVLSYWWDKTKAPKHWYLDLHDVSWSEPIVNFFSAMLLLQYMIPIAIYVSLEMVKFAQGFFIMQDVKMYYDETDTPAAARTSTLNEELGHVSHIFSDKTGTLTRNVMCFRHCSINGRLYGDAYSEPEASPTDQGSVAMSPRVPKTVTSYAGSAGDEHFAFFDPEFMASIEEDSPHGAVARDFVLALAVCHDVQVEEVEGEEGESRRVFQYKAASPDEAALVGAARHLGTELRGSVRGRLSLADIRDKAGPLSEVTVSQMLEFTSARRRMSVLVQREDGGATLYCKGADSMLAPRLHASQTALGFRTLLVCRRDLSKDEYERWVAQHTQASLTLHNRDEAVEAVSDAIERDLILLGATAVEDRLQDGVSTTIRTLQAANIKIWVLTGDKQETAVDIGLSCGLLERDMPLVIVNSTDPGEILSQLEAGCTPSKDVSDRPRAFLSRAPWLKSASNANFFSRVRQSLEDNNESLPQNEPATGAPEREGVWKGLVIDGAALATIEADKSERLLTALLRLCEACTSVVCCRMSPAQKAGVVEMVRRRLGRSITTLAIGDGANDVPMIQSAHIGIGISGFEGMQAVCASDYAISQFRFLQRLLLIHGRWAYRRNSKLTLYIFYKCFAFALCLVWFSCYSAWSQQQLYNEWAYQFYNTFFTSLPVLAMGAFDQDVGEDHVQQYPFVYQQGQRRQLFNLALFARWCLSGTLQSLFIFFISAYACQSIFWPSGRPIGLWSLGIIVYTCVVVVVNVRIAMMTAYHTWINSGTIVLSIIAWFTFMLLVCSVPSVFGYGIYKDLQLQMTSLSFYLIVLVATVAALLRDWTWRCFIRLFMPNPVHMVQEKERLLPLRGKQLPSASGP